jgi:hypothetical protein
MPLFSLFKKCPYFAAYNDISPPPYFDFCFLIVLGIPQKQIIFKNVPFILFQPSDADISIDRDVYLYRSYLALKKFGVVRDEINGNSPTLLQPLKTLLAYLQSEENASRRENVVAEVEKQVQGGDGANTTSILVNASILYHEENYEMTLRVLHAAPSDHLESMALRLQTLLKMDRIDLAKKEVKSMQERDDDATLTQLAQAWVNMYMVRNTLIKPNNVIKGDGN